MLIQLCLILFLSSVFFIFFAFKHRKYWLRRGVPGPHPSLLTGNFNSLYGTRPGIFQLREWTKQFGKVYGIQYGWRNMLVISDPAMVHELLVTKFEYFHAHNVSSMVGDTNTNKWIHMFFAHGTRWKRLRSGANPAFSIRNLKKIMAIMDDSIKIAVDFMDKAREQRKPIDVHRHLVEMTFDVIARVALGQRDSRQFCSDKAALAIEMFTRTNNTPFEYICWVFPWFGQYVVHNYKELTGLLLGDPFHILREKLMNELRERKQKREQEQQKEEHKSVDFIDLFLDIESEEIVHCQQNGNGAFDKAASFGVEKKNTLEEIAMQLLLFLLAGFDTTANSLSVVCHNMANHPEVQDRMCEEIDAICTDEDPTYEQLGQLKYTDAVIKETLRLCPIAASVVNRVCAKTTELGKHTLEQGTLVQVDSISLHRNTELWGADAQQFRPERWLEGDQIPATYAFGGGPRICLGMRLALMEEKLALVRILRKFRIVRCAETETELNFTGQVVINPETVTVMLELRDSAD